MVAPARDDDRRQTLCVTTRSSRSISGSNPDLAPNVGLSMDLRDDRQVLLAGETRQGPRRVRGGAGPRQARARYGFGGRLS